VRAGASTGDRVFAILVDGRDSFVARTAASGATELVDLHTSAVVPGDIALGDRAGDPAAWWRNLSLVAVPAGGVPETVGALASDGRTEITIGAPTKDGVPVFVGTSEWGMARVYPFPAPVKGATPTSPSPSDPVPTALLDGWTPVSFHRRAALSLPVCAAKATGSEYWFDGQAYMLHVDGATENGYTTRARVRLGAGEACVSELTSTFYGVTVPPPAAGAKPPSKPGGPVTFLRADLVGKRAEGGRAPATGDVRKLDCALTPQ
jgi:hypothetical protein